MVAQAIVREQVDALDISVWSFEAQAQAAYPQAQRAVLLIPGSEFEEVFSAAPEMEFHHRYVQSLLTWIWFEVHENETPLEHLPDPIGDFYRMYEEPFARYWTI